MRTSEVLGQLVNEDVIEKAMARQEGDTKVGKDGVTRYWTKLPSGKYDWRKKKPKSGGASGGQTSADKLAKLKATLKNSDDAKLKGWASKPNNDPKLRVLAYNELKSRGVDVSDINLNTGKIKQAKEMFGGGDDDDSGTKTTTSNDTDIDFDVTGMTDDDDNPEMDWRNPDYIKKKFGGLKTKKLRNAADAFIHKKKTSEKDYKPPLKEINSLNRMYAQFLKTDSPLMIASGGAGVGKSYNLHAVAKYLGMKPFDGETDEPGDGDYDYVEAPEIKSDTQLVQLLQEHNGKTIMFDDSDNVLRQSDTMGIMKKATASSGKRIVGKKSANKSTNVPPFEFTGKIMFLTNMDQDDLTKNEHLNAIYSRALKKDLQFTKKEKLEMIEKLKHKMNFTGVDRLADKQEDFQEREEVFQLIKDNIDQIDPEKFNTRTFKEALEKKRSVDSGNQMVQDDPVMGQVLFGDVEDWREEVEKFLNKGETSNKLEKALEYFELM